MDNNIKELHNKQPFIKNTNKVETKNKFDTMSHLYTNWNEYNKPKEIYYDNLIADGKTEIIINDLVSFDSIDRDLIRYPQPFKFRIKFNPGETEKDAYILKNYKNVKYIQLEHLIIPRRYTILKENITISANMSVLNYNNVVIN